MPFNSKAGVDLNEHYAAAAAPPAAHTDILLNANGASPAVDESTFYCPGSPGIIRKPNYPLPSAPTSPPPRRTTGVLANREQAATPPSETSPSTSGRSNKRRPRAETPPARTRVTETFQPVYKTAEDLDDVIVPVYKTFEPRDNAPKVASNAAAVSHINAMAAQLRKIAAGKSALDKNPKSDSVSSHGDITRNSNRPCNRRHLRQALQYAMAPSQNKFPASHADRSRPNAPTSTPLQQELEHDKGFSRTKNMIAAAPVRSMSNRSSNIESQRWFHGNILRTVAEARLKATQTGSQCSNGVYLVREKVKNQSYVLSVFSPAYKTDVEHILMEKPIRAGNAAVNFYQISGYPRASFASVIEIVHALSRDARLSEAITQRREVLLRQPCPCTADFRGITVGKGDPKVISAVLPCQYTVGHNDVRKPNYPSHRSSYSLSPSPPTALAI